MLQDEQRYKELVEEFYEKSGRLPVQSETMWIRQEVIYDYLKVIYEFVKRQI